MAKRKKTASGRPAARTRKAARPAASTHGARRPRAKAAKKTAKTARKTAAARKTAKRPTTRAKKETAAARKTARAKAPAARAAKAKARAIKAKARKAPARTAAAKSTARASTAKAPATRAKARSTAGGTTTPRTAAKASAPRPARRPPTLDRERRRVTEEEYVPGPPSSLDLDRTASAARTGRAEYEERLREHTSTGPTLTGGDIDADWEDAETVGDEAPGGDNPTPDQDIVDEIGRAMGVEYEDDEELQGGEQILERDRRRWELDPASREDEE